MKKKTNLKFKQELNRFDYARRFMKKSFESFFQGFLEAIAGVVKTCGLFLETLSFHSSN